MIKWSRRLLRKNNAQLAASNKEIADYTFQVTVQKGKNRLTNEEIAKWIERNIQEIKIK